MWRDVGRHKTDNFPAAAATAALAQRCSNERLQEGNSMTNAGQCSIGDYHKLSAGCYQ